MMALLKPFLTSIWFALICGLAWGHADPKGDIHPHLEVVGGLFSITFQTDNGNMDNLLSYVSTRIIYAPDGKVVVPRHRLPARPYLDSDFGRQRNETQSRQVVTTNAKNLVRFALEIPQDRNAPLQRPLPMPPEKDAMVLDSTVTETAIGFTWKRTLHLAAPFWAPSDELHLAHADATGATGSTVLLGIPASMFVPVSSPPVWAGGRWWVAWIRESPSLEERNDPMKRWQTLLSNYDPVKQVLNHQILDQTSHWNTSVQLKTTGGWLCAAWHASVDGIYPGVAKICTAFVEVPN